MHLKSVRQKTRTLVRSLDFRDFAVVTSGLYSTDASERAISESFRILPRLFPELACLLINGHPELNPESLILAHTEGGIGNHQALQLLDVANCIHPLNNRFFQSVYLRNLIYLDLSCLPGSIGNLVHHSLRPEFLPELRILKVRHRELDDSTARVLLQAFKRQLWSLDLSGNKLTDTTIDTLIDSAFSAQSFRSEAHFETEGKLVNPQNIGTLAYGPFDLISESDNSGTFTHPARYLPDAPPYNRRGSQQDLQEWQVVRSTGVSPIREDSADTVRACLLSDPFEGRTNLGARADNTIRNRRGGITHLYLNGNRFTSMGIQKLLRCTWGRLEHFECDQAYNKCAGTAASSIYEIGGLFGISHLLRPVFASNLRSVRLHHSVVTHIPELTTGASRSWPAAVLAEGVFGKRIEMAYPRPFVPEMNPRLISLTLTGIPKKSTGTLVTSLIRFLDLVSGQQHAVKDAPFSSAKRGAKSLSGLRHVRLELAPDLSEDLSIDMLGSETDYDRLLDPASWGVRQERPKSPVNEIVQPNNSGRATELTTHGEDFYSTKQEYISCRIDASASWTGNVFTVQVWVGSGIKGSRPAVNEYISNLRNPILRRNPVPAMPHHVAAGVPAGVYIFHDAWEAMIRPPTVPKVHELSSLSAMKDVAAAIKQYRTQTRGTDRYWTGKLELVSHSHHF